MGIEIPTARKVSEDKIKGLEFAICVSSLASLSLEFTGDARREGGKERREEEKGLSDRATSESLPSDL